MRAEIRGVPRRRADADPMRRLLLLRHGKSAWPEGVDDGDRPLAKRGRAASKRMGRHMAAAQLVPDVALISPARRAQETWELAKSALGSAKARTEPRIYEASPERLLAVIQDTDDDAQTLLLVGHNPGFQELVQLLTAEEISPQEKRDWKYPTAALAVLDFPIARWGDISPGSGILHSFVTPKALEKR